MTATTAPLYGRDVLRLAVDLARFPNWAANDGLDAARVRTGRGTSPVCGSTLDMQLALDADGRVDRVGLKVQACALGQASAALFADAAHGKDAAAIRTAYADVSAWLAGTAPLPDWPGFSVLSAAPSYPARHGSILLPFKVAAEMMDSNA